MEGVWQRRRGTAMIHRLALTACLCVATSASARLRTPMNDLMLDQFSISWSVRTIAAGAAVPPPLSSEMSLSFVRPAANDGSQPAQLWIWPQSIASIAQRPVTDPHPCELQVNTTPVIAQRGGFFVCDLDVTGACAQTRVVQTQDPPEEALWPGSTVYLDDRDVLFSYGGLTTLNLTTTPCVSAPPQGFNCSQCGTTAWKDTCLVPSARTHMFIVEELRWVHLDFDETGSAAPVSTPAVRSSPDGLFALGLTVVYDRDAQRVLAVGGYQELSWESPPPWPSAYAPLFAFSLTSNMWSFLPTNATGVPPPGPNIDWSSQVSAAPPMFDLASRSMILYNGLEINTVMQSGSCFSLDVDALVWTALPSCWWQADTAPFFLSGAAVTDTLTDIGASLWIGGSIGDSGSSMASPNADAFLLDASSQTWIASPAQGDETSFLSVRARPFTLQRKGFLQLHTLSVDVQPSQYTMLLVAYGGVMLTEDAALPYYTNDILYCGRIVGGAALARDHFLERTDVVHAVTLTIPRRTTAGAALSSSLAAGMVTIAWLFTLALILQGCVLVLARWFPQLQAVARVARKLPATDAAADASCAALAAVAGLATSLTETTPGQRSATEVTLIMALSTPFVQHATALLIRRWRPVLVRGATEQPWWRWYGPTQTVLRLTAEMVAIAASTALPSSDSLLQASGKDATASDSEDDDEPLQPRLGESTWLVRLLILLFGAYTLVAMAAALFGLEFQGSLTVAFPSGSLPIEYLSASVLCVYCSCLIRVVAAAMRIAWIHHHASRRAAQDLDSISVN